MRVPPGEARPGEPLHLAVGDDAVGRRLLVVEMTALDDHDVGPQRGELAARDLHVRARGHLGTHQPRGLGQVGRDDGGDRQQHLAQHLHRVFGQQRVAVLRHEHGIDDEPADAEVVQRGRDRRDQLGRGEHPGLGRVDADVDRDCCDLPAHQVGAHQLEGLHTQRVLRGHRHDRGRSPHAVRLERLEVGDDARAAPRVGARDGERDRGSRRHHVCSHPPSGRSPSANRRSPASAVQRPMARGRVSPAAENASSTRPGSGAAKSSS